MKTILSRAHRVLDSYCASFVLAIVLCGLFMPQSSAQSVTTNPSSNASTSPTSITPSVAEEDVRPALNQSLTMEDAVQTALKYSPVVRGAQADILVAQAQIDAIRANRKPTVSATTFLTIGNESNIFSTPAPVMPQNLFAVPSGGFANQNLMLMWPLSTGGRLRALLRQGQAVAAASQKDSELVQLDLALETKTAYRQVLLAQALKTVAEDRHTATVERTRIDRARAEAGRIPALYVLRDEAEEADAAQGVTNADRDIEIAQIVLQTTMGVSPLSHITLADSLENVAAVPFAALPPQPTSSTTTADSSTRNQNETTTTSTNSAATDAEPASPTSTNSAATNSKLATSADVLSLATLLETARAQRPDLQAARRRLEGSAEGINAARNAFKPQIALMAMADLGRSRGASSSGASAGIVLGVPIFDGGLKRAQTAEARAQKQRAQADYDRLQLQVEREVQTALVTQTAAARNLATTEAAVKAAEENSRVAALRYEAGRATNAEVLDALAALTRARVNRVQAAFDVAVARDQLARAAGNR